MSWGSQDGVVNVECIHHITSIEETFIVFRLNDSSLGDKPFAKIFIPNTSSLLLPVEITMEFQDNVFSVDTTRNFESSWELHINVSVDGSLGVCGDIVHLLGLPSKSRNESQKKTDRHPQCHRCIGFVIVFSFSHPGAIIRKVTFMLLNLSGKNIPFAY